MDSAGCRHSRVFLAALLVVMSPFAAPAEISAAAAFPQENYPQKREHPGVITDVDRKWWAFQPLTNVEPPRGEGDAWSQNAIDRFIRQRQYRDGIIPAPRAGKSTLVRRLYLNVVGMPPTPEQVDAFVNDPSPDAWENLVDRLLDDPRYGEHWARFWLDLVRYAESDGWKQDAYRPHIWRYRDYVVNAFNSDKPYTDFVREQLAGDEIPGDDPANITATGFLRLGIFEYNQRDAKPHWNDIINEITDVTGNVFFGLSMSCSRCHDHKFDPILQTDYYSLRAFFEPMVWKDNVVAATQAQKAESQAQLAAWEAASADVRAQIDALCKPYFDKKWETTVEKFPLEIQACFRKPESERTSWEQQMYYLVARQFWEEGDGPYSGFSKEDKEKLNALKARLAQFDDIKPKALPEVMAVADYPGTISPTSLPNDPGNKPIAPRFLTVLASDGVQCDPPKVPNSTGRRSALSAWITRPDNPLTPRVIVNRIWQQHFGEGIVRSANDFGRLGNPPTDPELLDWLTQDFINHGWQFKRLHKLILMSQTWQQSADNPHAASNLARDPDETAHWRWKVRRLTAEQIRDAMLLASGELDSRVGGPSVDAKTPRRALYVKVFRNAPDELMHAFDAADGLTCVAQRTNTTTPTQALLMINGDYVIARATKLAERIRDAKFETRDDALDYAFRLAWGRSPSSAERGQAIRFVGPATDPEGRSIDQDKLADFCHVLFISNEFLYVD